MQVFWEKTGVLGPIYLLASKGVSDSEISNRLQLPPATVVNCVNWLLRFLRLKDRPALVLRAGNSPLLTAVEHTSSSSAMVEKGCPHGSPETSLHIRS